MSEKTMKHKPYGPYERFIKRPLDFFLALLALIVLSPLFVVLIIVGAIVMRGNPFFTQLRPGKIGRDGKEKIFKLIKFRTMSNAKDSDGNLLPDEKRLNRYGCSLRTSSLDELPELLSIIQGNMAIVGPRPLLVQYLDRYNEHQARRHEVRPGFTGLAQVNGRNAISWEEKFDLDVKYVDRITFLGDCKIILKTVVTVLKHEGISSSSSVTMEEFMGIEENHK